MDPGLVLRLPRPDEEDAFLRAHAATSPEVPHFLHDYREGLPLVDYLRVLDERARGVHLPPGHVPSTFLFAFHGRDIVGRVVIRHHLNEALLQNGGHIGYTVVPPFRRRGHGTAMLAHALRLAREQLGLTRVLLTCNDDNIGSIRIIEKNGGRLENRVMSAAMVVPRRRYWIELADR